MIESPPRAAAPKTSRLAPLIGAVTGRRSKWIVLLVWIAIVAAASPLGAKLTDVEKNDNAAWLPSNAESLKVSNLEETFANGERITAVIAYHRAGGLTEADLAKIKTDHDALAAKYGAGETTEIQPSQDKQAALFTVSFNASQGTDFTKDVTFARDLIHANTNGMQAKLTGPAGYTSDLIDVFGGLDVTLLGASAAVVAVLLLLTYRSPFVWLIPLLTVGFASQLASGSVYGLAKHAGLAVNGQSGGILPVLVFGAGTDYALLLVSRYREELRRHEDKHEAMAFALRQAGPAVVASSCTVVIGLLCLLAADLNSNRGLGAVGAVGIVSALLAMMTLLPALLVIFGRRLFWPFIPRFGSETHEESGLWSRIGAVVRRRPRPVWLGTAAVLVVFALGLLAIDTSLPQTAQFRTKPESLAGQTILSDHFSAGAGTPATIIANAAQAQAVLAAIGQTEGVATAYPTGTHGDLASFNAALTAPPGSPAAFATIDRLRANVHAIANANGLVGGTDAISLDVARANSHDRKVIMPLVLLVVLVILGLLLRAVVAPVILILTVVLSFAASLGVSVFVFRHLFHFEGMDGSTPLLGFVFLVALGIDYNIFLMSRVHEESVKLGTRRGMLKGLSVTGGVITSAGLVLAATFAVLSVLPLVTMTEIGFLVAFGVLLDTFIVRSILVPALTFDLGRVIWWPSRLSRES